METGFRRVLARVPFAVRELHPDNGSEFFNTHLVRFWKDKVVGVQLSCNRPYQKNDNRMVEQKNDSLVCQYLGHWRFGTAEQVEAINLLESSHVALLQSVPTGDALNHQRSGRQQGSP